ncbi:MAG: hypothetical protein LC104_09240 [Bacteroidales bacterium]|nr:hypothetical protein [Bacteroidales bacterium]
MRRVRFDWWLVFAGVICTVGGVSAQSPKVVIQSAEIGLPPGPFTPEPSHPNQPVTLFKSQCWAPIALKLTLQEPVSGSAQLRVETTDDDDLRTTLTVPLGDFSAHQPGMTLSPVDWPYTPYVRPGDVSSGTVTVTVLDAAGIPLSAPFTQRYLRGRNRSAYIMATLGASVPGLDLPNPHARADAPETNRSLLRGGRVETAVLTELHQLPDRAIGYDAVDLVILATGSAPQAFLTELFHAPAAESRRAALSEWVRRGGKLLITVGENARTVAQYPAFRELIPLPFVTEEPSRAVADLTINWLAPGGLQKTASLRGQPGTKYPLARFSEKGHTSRVLLRHAPLVNDPDQTEYPLVMQTAYGLGRVTLVAIDLDRAPFLDLPTEQKASFWDWLIRKADADRASVNPDPNAPAPGSTGNPTSEDGFAQALKDHVDDFQEVPVISFGWVALLIAFYTLLIGPVEYLFLKKVIGRLEFTWLTFPLIVLSVSTAAYFTAYAIKGDALRINKVDLVDLDPDSGRVYGRTWFTIFSPRIDSYTIGVTPRSDWQDQQPPGSRQPSVHVDWLAGGRTGGGNIVSRGYTYHTNLPDQQFADGLMGVPIPVWSTKAFQADWSATLSRTAPLVESRLYHPPGDPNALAGRIVSRLPFGTLRDAQIVYAGAVYKLDPLVPGVPVTPILDPSTIHAEWLRTQAALTGIGEAVPGSGPTEMLGSHRQLSLWGMLFHEKALPPGTRTLQNASFRQLDQSWRFDPAFRDQAMILARVGPVRGAAESLLTAADSPSPTTLWRSERSPDQSRAPLAGVLRQETYIRMFLPIAQQPIGDPIPN